jgi:L-threonylcarbamoyladenylate synthase
MRRHIHDSDLPELLLSVLREGGVVVMPCDTIYGLVGVAPGAESRIRRLKGRQEKSFLRLIPSAAWLPRFTDMELPESLRAYWPGPLTVIFPAKESKGRQRPQRSSARPEPTVALRVPDDPLLLRLLQDLEAPLFSTSVNRSGEPPLSSIENIAATYEGQVDLVVDGGDLPGRIPSTIVDVTVRPFRVLRQGAVKVPRHALQGV